MDNGKNIRTKTDVVIFIAMGLIAMNMVVANLGLYGGRTSPPLLIGAFAMMLLSIWFIWQRKGISNFSVIKMLPLIIMGVIFLFTGSYLRYHPIYYMQLYLFSSCLCYVYQWIVIY